MRLVVADSSPLNYLVWIEQVEILPALFERIFVPEVVQNELRHSEAPESVRRWIAAPPSWLEIVPEEHESGEPGLVTPGRRRTRSDPARDTDWSGTLAYR
jgi:hypothetical protein